jgi:aspartate carbamoyltransferase catalytic subunit
MRNLFASILIALTVSTSGTSFAAAYPNPDAGKNEQPLIPSVSLSQLEKSKLDVLVENAVNSKFVVRLLDASGQIVTTQTFWKNETGTRIRFDLTSLEDGVYEVKVSDGKNSQLKKFELKTTVPAITSYQNVTVL